MSRSEQPVALLVGGGALAEAIAQRLATDGFHVVGTAAGPERIALDPRDEASWAAASAAIIAGHGRVDAVINASGSALHKPVAETSHADFREVWEANLETAVLGTKWAFRMMRDTASGGAVVNLASLAGTTGRADAAAWSAADAAVTHFSRIAAVESGDIVPPCRVNSVNPGAVTAEQVAAAVAWLAGAESRFVTGTALILGGA